MKRFLIIAVTISLVALMAGGAWAALGSHAVDAGGNHCAICHDNAQSARSRGWAAPVSTLTTEWLARPIAKLCYTCHSNAALYGASDQMTGGAGTAAMAYSTANHGYGASVISTPESWAGAGADEDYTATSLPYTGAGGEIDCTTCHNVHNNVRSPFVMLGSDGTDFTALCVKCHNRANAAPVLGSDNSLGTTARSYHPTSVEYTDLGANGVTALLDTMDSRLTVAVGAYPPAANWVLGGHLTDATTSTPGAAALISCGTCHQVHGSAAIAPFENQTADLLAIDSVDVHAISDAAADRNLCTGCHGNPFGTAPDGQVGAPGLTDHPLDGDTGRVFYPTSWNDGGTDAGIPTWWQGANRPASDVGATTYTPSTSQTPACSSCHDAHGGIAGESILYGPDSQTEGDWCFNCHPVLGVIPRYHHSCDVNDERDPEPPFVSQLGCGDCHGTKGGTANNDGNWAAHNGFWNLRTLTQPLSTTDSAFCELCHLDTNPTAFLANSKTDTTPYIGWVDAGTVLTDYFPSHHGPATTAGVDSHSVNTVGAITYNFVRDATFDWAAAANFNYTDNPQDGADTTATSQYNGTQVLCESCHSLLDNCGDLTADGWLAGGWSGNLLLAPYEDDVVGSTGAVEIGSTTNTHFDGQDGDAFCRVCHTQSLTASATNTDYVHYPAAHTVSSTVFTYTGWGSPVPYDHASTTDSLLTGGACPDRTTADAGGAPNDYSYPAANAVDCDTCHRAHNAYTDTVANGGGTTGHIIVQSPLAGSLPKTNACNGCHDIAIQCGQ